MPVHQDEIRTYIPSHTDYIILGTMGSINARTIDGVKPKNMFFYNDSRNHFWRVLQHLHDIDGPQKLSIPEKKQFVENHGIAICNIVKKAIVPKKFINDPSDTVLFEAYKKGNVEFKRVNSKFKAILKSKPMYFTCREKKGIRELLYGFLECNKLDRELYQNIHFLKSPTRCNPYRRSREWLEEMHDHQS